VSSEPAKPGVSRPEDGGAAASAASDGSSAETAAPKRSRAAKMAEGLHERREHHQQRSKPRRAATVTVGFIVTAAGIVMTGPVPGPGAFVIPIGLAILALEFDWAERLLHRALAYADRVGDQASELSTRVKVAIGVLAVLAVAAFVAAAITWDIPILPV